MLKLMFILLFISCNNFIGNGDGYDQDNNNDSASGSPYSVSKFYNEYFHRIGDYTCIEKDSGQAIPSYQYKLLINQVNKLAILYGDICTNMKLEEDIDISELEGIDLENNKYNELNYLDLRYELEWE